MLLSGIDLLEMYEGSNRLALSLNPGQHKYSLLILQLAVVLTFCNNFACKYI